MTLADQISLKPTALEVRRLNKWLDEKLVDSGVEKSLGDDLKLCLNEVLANLIAYGFRHTAEPFTLVQVRLEPGRASATVYDNGDRFDIREWQTPKDRDLRTAEPGGFGVALIKERASSIEYMREGELNRLDIVCESSTSRV